MTRADLLRELRECASLEDRKIARQRAKEALEDYHWNDGVLMRWGKDDEITAAYKAAIRMEED